MGVGSSVSSTGSLDISGLHGDHSSVMMGNKSMMGVSDGVDGMNSSSGSSMGSLGGVHSGSVSGNHGAVGMGDQGGGGVGIGNNTHSVDSTAGVVEGSLRSG